MARSTQNKQLDVPSIKDFIRNNANIPLDDIAGPSPDDAYSSFTIMPFDEFLSGPHPLDDIITPESKQECVNLAKRYNAAVVGETPIERGGRTFIAVQILDSCIDAATPPPITRPGHTDTNHR